MNSTILLVILAVLGLLAYALPVGNAKVMRIGEIIFQAALIALCIGWALKGVSRL